MLKNLIKVICIMTILGLTACQNLPPIKTVAQVDVDRFMGDWYVIAAIPTFMESDPYNPVEHYDRNADGTIATTFAFNQGGFDGKLKTYHPTGFVVPDSGNAEWKMQFLWPFKAEYLIAYLSDDAQLTIIARNKRDYVWLMSRKPSMDQATFDTHVEKIKAMGYDISKLEVFPHLNVQPPLKQPL
jgi:apolipoprotein D and lipocalin family protein